MAIHTDRMAESQVLVFGSLRFDFETTQLCWQPDGEPAQTLDCSNEEAKAGLALLGKGAKRNRQSFALLLRLALARADGTKDGWVPHEDDLLARLPGWGELHAGTRTNKARDSRTGRIIEGHRSAGRRRAVRRPRPCRGRRLLRRGLSLGGIPRRSP